MKIIASSLIVLAVIFSCLAETTEFFDVGKVVATSEGDAVFMNVTGTIIKNENGSNTSATYNPTKIYISGNVPDGKKMILSIVLAAKAQGKKVQFIYDLLNGRNAATQVLMEP